MTTWSSTSTSSSRPAAIASAVRWRSSGLGVGSPDGWLWTRTTPRGVEPDGVAEQLPDPHQRRRDVADVDVRDALHDVLRVEAQDPQLLALEAAHLERAAGPRRRAATRIVQRPAGQSATDRRPSSNAAASRAALAAPTPGIAASSASLARASAPTLACRREGVLGELDRAPAPAARARARRR